jgi:hypothetical protein
MEDQNMTKIKERRQAIEGYRLAECTLHFAHCEVLTHVNQRPLDQEQVDKLVNGFRKEGVDHSDAFLAVFDDDPANLPTGTGVQTVRPRIKIFSGQHRYHALVALGDPNEFWWPVVLYSRGMSAAWITCSH